jgi:hypothetical protein
VKSTSPGRAINPALAGAQQPTSDPATDRATEPEQPPTRRVVRLDAEYLNGGRRVAPPPDAAEQEDELIALPRRWGSVGLLPRLLRRLFRV